jgi:hypothetical protein
MLPRQLVKNSKKNLLIRIRHEGKRTFILQLLPVIIITWPWLPEYNGTCNYLDIMGHTGDSESFVTGLPIYTKYVT